MRVVRADGRAELVRVGTARREGDGFTLELGELSLGAAVDRPAPAPRAAPASGGGIVFPNYGRSKGVPVAGASTQDLEFYANGCRRTLNDPSKSRWHDKERVLLAAIEGELARQSGEAPPASSRDDAPPLSDDDAPLPSDDDVPF
ncbi:MAG TPA: hypothetical protein VGQ83_33280 [Polyangia bacterium]